MNNSLQPANGEAWPADELEQVRHCPICQETKRDLFYEGLTDRLFGSPGQWTMVRCQGCGSSYLDPRPTRETIGMAYKNYFTHEMGRGGRDPSLLRRVMRNLGNGYHNKLKFPIFSNGRPTAGARPPWGRLYENATKTKG